MKIGDVLGVSLPELQAQAESTMRATCVIDRPTGEQSTGDDGVVTAVYAPVYEGKCKLADFNSQAADSEAGGASVVSSQPITKIPVHAPKVIPGDRVTITADLDSPVNAGAVMTVSSIRRRGLEKSRHLLCEEIQTGAL